MKFGVFLLLFVSACASAPYARLAPANPAELDCAGIAMEEARAQGFRAEAAGRAWLLTGKRREAVKSADARLAMLADQAALLSCTRGV